MKNCRFVVLIQCTYQIVQNEKKITLVKIKRLKGVYIRCKIIILENSHFHAVKEHSPKSLAVSIIAVMTNINSCNRYDWKFQSENKIIMRPP